MIGNDGTTCDRYFKTDVKMVLRRIPLKVRAISAKLLTKNLLMS